MSSSSYCFLTCVQVSQEAGELQHEAGGKGFGAWQAWTWTLAPPSSRSPWESCLNCTLVSSSAAKSGWWNTSHMVQFSSVQLSSCSVMSNSLPPHELEHTRPPCPSPTPGVYPNSCPSSRWSHPAISSSVVSFSSCPQSLPASGSFPMSQLFAWSGQSIGVSPSASVLPMNTQEWSPLGWTGLISLQFKGLSRVRVKCSQWWGLDITEIIPISCKSRFYWGNLQAEDMQD